MPDPTSLLQCAGCALGCRYELPAAKLASLLNPLVAFHPQLLPWLAPELVKEGAPPVTEKVRVQCSGCLLPDVECDWHCSVVPVAPSVLASCSVHNSGFALLLS